jgi:hypothetical protein
MRGILWVSRFSFAFKQRKKAAIAAAFQSVDKLQNSREDWG